jgi:hypothetical protein
VSARCVGPLCRSRAQCRPAVGENFPYVFKGARSAPDPGPSAHVNPAPRAAALTPSAAQLPSGGWLALTREPSHARRRLPP